MHNWKDKTDLPFADLLENYVQMNQEKTFSLFTIFHLDSLWMRQLLETGTNFCHHLLQLCIAQVKKSTYHVRCGFSTFFLLKRGCFATWVCHIWSPPAACSAQVVSPHHHPASAAARARRGCARYCSLTCPWSRSFFQLMHFPPRLRLFPELNVPEFALGFLLPACPRPTYIWISPDVPSISVWKFCPGGFETQMCSVLGQGCSCQEVRL